MIFSAITHTPCVVARSQDHKIVQTYEWVKDVPTIQLVDDLTPQTVEDAIKKVIVEEEISLDLEPYFDKLAEIIRGLVQEHAALQNSS